MPETDYDAAVDAFERRLDPAEHDVPPLDEVDMDDRLLYLDPTRDLDDPIARHAVQSRSMDATRAIIDNYRHEIIRLLRTHQPGHPPVHGAATRALNLLHRAEAEVLRAERGCGQPDGECTDPCHAGVHDA